MTLDKYPLEDLSRLKTMLVSMPGTEGIVNMVDDAIFERTNEMVIDAVESTIKRITNNTPTLMDGVYDEIHSSVLDMALHEPVQTDRTIRKVAQTMAEHEVDGFWLALDTPRKPSNPSLER